MSAISLTLLLLLPAATAFVVHKADSSTASAPLGTIDADWSITLADRPPTRVKGDDLLSLRRAETFLPPFPTGPQVLFVNGDRLAGTVRTIANESVAFLPAAANAPELKLPLSSLAVLWLAEPAGEGDAARQRRRLMAEVRKRDVLWLRNGDVLEGTLNDLDKDGLHVEIERRETIVDRSKAAYVALNSELAGNLRPKGIYARLTLADGSRLSLASAELDGTALVGRTLFGADFRVPLDQVVALYLRQGRAVYLSDLDPQSYEHTPWSRELKWPFVRDGSVGGRDLTLGGSTFDKGLGMHCHSEITFAFGGVSALRGTGGSRRPGGEGRRGAHARADRRQSASPGLGPRPDGARWSSASALGRDRGKGTNSGGRTRPRRLVGPTRARQLGRCPVGEVRAQRTSMSLERIGSGVSSMAMCWASCLAW